MKSLRERLLSGAMIVPSGCWQWTRSVNSRGYSLIGVDGKVLLGHRVSYEMHVGPIADGLQIDHLCHNKRCINPAHLEVVTNQVNNSRRLNANKSHCLRGHEMTEDNTIIKKRAGGLVQRNCRTCSNERRRVGRAA